MKQFLVALVLALPLAAQEATLNTPVTHNSEAKNKIRKFYVDTGGSSNQGLIEISVQDSSNVEIRYFNATVPGCGTTTVGGLATAMITVRATETGTDARKLQFRILGYLSDQNCLTGVTLNP